MEQANNDIEVQNQLENEIRNEVDTVERDIRDTQNSIEEVQRELNEAQEQLTQELAKDAVEEAKAREDVAEESFKETNQPEFNAEGQGYPQRTSPDHNSAGSYHGRAEASNASINNYNNNYRNNWSDSSRQGYSDVVPEPVKSRWGIDGLQDELKAVNKADGGINGMMDELNAYGGGTSGRAEASNASINNYNNNWGNSSRQGYSDVVPEPVKSRWGIDGLQDELEAENKSGGGFGGLMDELNALGGKGVNDTSEQDDDKDCNRNNSSKLKYGSAAIVIGATTAALNKFGILPAPAAFGINIAHHVNEIVLDNTVNVLDDFLKAPDIKSMFPSQGSK